MTGTRTIRLDLSTRRNDGDCTECGFESLVRMSAVELQDSGVKVWFEKTCCVRCEDMKRDDR